MARTPNAMTIGAMLAAATAAPALAQVDLELRAITPVVDVADLATVGVYAVAPAAPASTIGAFEAIITWDTAKLQLVGTDPANPAGLIFQGFPAAGSSGLNEATPPADGDALLIGLGPLGTPIVATPGGTLLAVLRFNALSGTPGTPIDLLATAGSPPTDTVVFDGVTPNTIVTGSLAGTEIIVSCGPADLAPPIGILDLDDVDVFINAFTTGDPLADLAAPVGILDLDDIDAFIGLFLLGCP